MLNECHVFAYDVSGENPQQEITGSVEKLLQSIGFSEEWAKSFVADLLKAKTNPEEDKLEADLDHVNIVLDEVATFANEDLVYFNDQVAAADEEAQEDLQQKHKENLELLKLRLEQMVGRQGDD